MRLNDGIEITLDPIFNETCTFISFKSEEKYLGSIPEITIQLKSNKDLVKVLDEITGKITQGGNSIDFKAYVYSTSFSNNTNIIKLLCCDSKFTREVQLSKFTSMSDILSSCYSLGVTKNCDSSVSGVDLYQKSESNHAFLSRMLLAYKQDAIFGYTVGGLRIHDLTNYKSEVEYQHKADISPITDNQLTDPKLFSDEVEVLEEYTNHVLLKYNSAIVQLNKEYETLVSNYIHNQRYIYNTRGDYQFSLKYIPKISLTDGITIKTSETTMREYFVTSRMISIDASSCVTSIGLGALNPI